jgi:hypothetical protein
MEIMGNCKEQISHKMYRGLKDFESKVSFCEVSQLKNLKVSRIFAGGNHSWAIIDSRFPQKAITTYKMRE